MSSRPENDLDSNGGRDGDGGTETDDDDDEDYSEDGDSDDVTFTDDDEILVIGQRLYPTFECGTACM